ncbi:hypothetical protein NQ315_007349 [Exocentrus adspersus]|uniref:Cytochrome P450 n=1 Tax=Exocentrus adspersus TaxID=1586481 RepID=A0AAV8VHT2_9CUCU|nr:hypothetical protein NQ315_007349 [Exocentrus adspersus]
MTLYFGSYMMDLLALVTTLLAATYVYIIWTFQYWKKRNVPYLDPVIPWGNFENPMSRSVSLSEDIARICQKAIAKGWKYFGMYALTQVNFVVLDLDLVKQIMTKDFQNFVDRGFYYNEKDDPLSAHLFSIGGNKWRRLRTKLSPTFTSGKMKSMFSTLADCGLLLEKYIQNSVDNVKGNDIKEIVSKFSTDVIGSCAFGLQFNSFVDVESPFRLHGRKLFDGGKILDVKVAIGNAFPNFSKAVHLTTTPKDTSDFFRKVVEDTITYRWNNNVTRNDFLQLLLELMDKKSGAMNGITDNVGYRNPNFFLTDDENKLTMDEAAAQCFVFFVAGFETSSTTMTFALYQLAVNQDIQDKVRKEIKIVLAKHDNQITYDSLNELKYMKQVIDETLRMYAPVPFVTRQAAEDYKLPGEDVIIEKGVVAVIPIQAIHMNEEIYPVPNKFDPDRFSEENKAGRHPYAHIPFGEGPRICIGERFGIMQTKVGLTTVLRNFRVTLNKKTKYPLKLSTKGFIPSADGGVWLNFEKI